jgi:uncharacterized membrane protein SirB2
MKTNNPFKAAFAFSIVNVLIASYFKIMHLGYATPFLIIGLLLTLVYIVLGITEVQNSKKIAQKEKMIWTLGFIFLGFFTGLFYLASGRKRIV